MPILRRTCTGSIPGAYTSMPSTRTLPATRAPGTTSCIRLRHRMKVDLPQPDGPMIAVTALGAIVTPIPRSTWALPNHALRSRTTIPSAMFLSYPRDAAARCHARRQAYHENQGDQHERPRPRLAVPVVIGRDRVRKDLERQRRDRLVESVVPEAISERREEQRRRLAGDARDSHHDARDDPGTRRRQDHAQQDLPLLDPERQGRLAQGARNQSDQFFAGPHHDRQHDHRQGKRPGDRREPTHRQHNDRVRENPDDDRRNPVEHVGQEPRHPRQPPVTRLGEVEPAEDAERQTEDGGQREEDESADDRVGHATADLTDGSGQMREEVYIHRRRALPEQKAEDQEQWQHDEAGRRRGQPGHHDVHGATGRRGHSRTSLIGPPTDHTRSRASALTTTVTMKSKRPIWISAER